MASRNYSQGKEAIHKAPLLVNVLRFIRNRRLPSGDVYGHGSTNLAWFEFAGLSVQDCGPFREALAVWDLCHARERSSFDPHAGERNSTFAGPLHMLVLVDGVTVEHWKLEDFREDHTENSFGRAQEHVAKLHDFARVLYTYLCCSEVSATIDKAAREVLARGGPHVEALQASSSHVDSLVSSANQGYCTSGSGAETPLTGCTVTPAVAAAGRSTWSVPPSPVGFGRLAYRGTELLVLGSGFSDAEDTLRERGLFAKVNADGDNTRYEQHHWYLEDLVGVGVVRDTTPWFQAAALPSAVVGASRAKESNSRAESPTAPAPLEEETVPVEPTVGPVSPPPQAPLLQHTETTRQDMPPVEEPLKAATPAGDTPVAPEMLQEMRRQGMAVFYCNPVTRAVSTTNSPGLLPGPASPAGGSTSTTPSGSQVRRLLNAPPAWTGDLSRRSFALSGAPSGLGTSSRGGNGSDISASARRTTALPERPDGDAVATSAAELVTLCKFYQRKKPEALDSLDVLLQPLRQ